MEESDRNRAQHDLLVEKRSENVHCLSWTHRQTGDERVVFIDEVQIDDQGLLTVDGPTTTEKEL